MSVVQKAIGSGLLFVITVAIGFVLSNLGRPYNAAVFNVHKLIALASVALGVMVFAYLLKRADDRSLIMALAVIAALSTIGLFASGALLSAGNMSYGLLRAIHVVTSISGAAVVVAATYLVMRR